MNISKTLDIVSNFLGKNIKIIKLSDLVFQSNYDINTKRVEGSFDSYEIIEKKALIYYEKEKYDEHECSIYIESDIAQIGNIIIIDDKNYSVVTIETLYYDSEKIDLVTLTKSNIDILI